MKAIILLALLFLISARTDSETERRCKKEIRDMNCGSPEDQRAFIACIDFHYDELTEECRDHHKAEMERVKNDQYSSKL